MSDTQALATLGVPGLLVLVAALSGVVVFLYRALMKERDARLQDLKDYQAQAKALSDASAAKEDILYNKIEAARNGAR